MVYIFYGFIYMLLINFNVLLFKICYIFNIILFKCFFI